VASAQGPKSVVERVFSSDVQYDMLLVPGGQGTRVEVDNPVILQWLRQQSEGAMGGRWEIFYFVGGFRENRYVPGADRKNAGSRSGRPGGCLGGVPPAQ
jgi:hypothetical protein